MKYKDFIKSKSKTFESAGIDVDKDRLNSNMFEFQKDIVRWALKKGRAAIFAECGLGKGQPYGSKILTSKGWIEIQNLKVGDYIISSDGKPHKVKGVFPKGEIETYRFYFSDGVSCVFDKEHLHIVRTRNDKARGNKWRVMSTSEILKADNLRYGNGNKSRNYDIPVVEPIRFKKKDLYISPYIMGVLIGDGHLKGNCNISNSDSELLEKIKKELHNGLSLSHASGYDYRIKTGLTGNKRHKFRKELMDLGLLGKLSHDKFILLCEGWCGSKGCNREFEFARKNNIRTLSYKEAALNWKF